MGKEKREKKALGSLRELSEVAANGELKLAATTNPTPPASQPALPKLPPPAPQAEPVVTTVAGKKEYDSFFALYHQWVKGRREGEFVPLGFIPGPAVIGLAGLVVRATPDTKLKPLEEIRGEVATAIGEWRRLVAALGFQPSPWYLNIARRLLSDKAPGRYFARRLLSGKAPGRYLTAGMPRFRYRSGDPEVPFGVVLLPTEEGMLVSRVYNPRNIPDVPKVGDHLSFAILKDGKGPVQKLVRTWALMEANYASRYHRDGTPRESNPA